MTSFVSGTADNHTDLFNKLVAFLKTDPTLVAAGQNWTQVWSSGGDIVLKGPGLSGGDNIFVGMRLVVDTTYDVYQLLFSGMTGVLSSSTVFDGHVNTSPVVGIYLDTQPITYWFVASGRRFIVILQVGGTVFESAYCGYFLPYAAPNQYPYPMFVGGTFGAMIYGLKSYRSVEAGHTSFFNPSTSTGAYAYSSSAKLLDPSGVWYNGMSMELGANATTNSSFMVGPRTMGDGNQASQWGTTWRLPGYARMRDRTMELYGGGYALTPITLAQQVPANQTFGVFDGVYDVSGHNTSAGDLIAVDGINHLVVQNVFRTGWSDFCAVKLG